MNYIIWQYVVIIYFLDSKFPVRTDCLNCQHKLMRILYIKRLIKQDGIVYYRSGVQELTFFLNALFAISRTSLALMLIYLRYKSFYDGDYSTPGLFSVGKETSVFSNASRPYRPYSRLSFESIAATLFVGVKQPMYEFDPL